MKTLLHTCCAPCSVECINSLRTEGIEPTAFWFNPNIHPFTEYKVRRNTLRDYTASINVPLIEKDDYGLRSFITAVHEDFNKRCTYCYKVRMDAAAEAAASNGFDSFSTSLLISPYQNHELLRKTGEESARKYGVSFLYRDFRPFFRDGQQKSRALQLYMQKYCGCIFSEEDRYSKKKKTSDSATA